MTLPSTCLSAEPTAAPSDLLAICGAAAQSPGAAPSGTPFASLLTQADGTGALGCVPPGVLVAAIPATILGSAAPTAPAVYPGIYYMAQVPTQVQASASGSEVLTPAVCTAPEIVGEKPPVRCGPSSPKEKPKASAKAEDVSRESGVPRPVSMELVYQFVAGQWMPPPVLQVPLQAQTSGDNRLIQNSLPGLEQSVAQGMPAPAAPLNRTSETQIPPAANQTSISEQALAKNTIVRVSTDLPSATVPVASSPSFPIPAEPPILQQKVAQVSLDSVATPRPAAPPASSTPPPPATADDALPFALEQPGAEQATVALAESTGMYAPSRRFTQGRPTPNQAPEKFAAPITTGRPEIVSGVNPSMSIEEKKSLSIDSKPVTTTQKNVGTSTANREIAMSYSAVNKSPSVDFSTTLGDGLQPNISTETKADTTLAAHAPKLVQEIRAIADRISVIDRNSVEVRFDFNDTERLSVRVEYRDGTVHTTFKTDSSQLRDVVAHEWQSQNSSSEQRSYRMADPVFSQTAADRQNSPGTHDGSGRQRAFEQPAQHGAPSFSSSGRSAGATTPVAAPSARSARPETSQHLHALA